MYEVHLVASFVPAESFGWYLSALAGAGVGVDASRTIWHPGGPRILVRRAASSQQQATIDAVEALAAIGVQATPRG